MTDPYYGEIRIFGFNFAPTGWAFCDGAIVPISQNTALFAILGTTYGGNGQSTFALPDLQGRAPMKSGNGPGLSGRDLGEQSGVETVPLSSAQIPVHTHNLMCLPVPADAQDPQAHTIARVIGAKPYLPPAGAPLVSMGAASIANRGAGLPHNNMQPFLTLNFCIATQGTLPLRG